MEMFLPRRMGFWVLFVVAFAATRELFHVRVRGGESTHWSFQPLRGERPPEVRNAAWPRVEPDRFIPAKLERVQSRQ
jgi:hypothetical protein